MSVSFSFNNKNPLDLSPGYPPDYKGIILPGSRAFHSISKFGKILVQEIGMRHATIRHQFFHVLGSRKLFCHYQDVGIQTRAILQHKHCEAIPGAGRIILQEGEFASMITRSWTSIGNFQSNHPVSFIDTIWSPVFMNEYLSGESRWNEILQNTHPNGPNLIGQPYRQVSDAMQMILHKIIDCPYSEPLRTTYLDDQIKEYFELAIEQVDNPYWLANGLSRRDIEKVYLARNKIASNLDQHFMIPDIAIEVGMNESKLKALFNKVTGKGMFEYLMYLRCLRTRDEILASDQPIKAFYKRTGYKSLASFITGFRRQLQCTPGDLRRKRR